MPQSSELAIEESNFSLKKQLWDFLEGSKNAGRAASVFEAFILCLIILNIIAVVVGTVESIEIRYEWLLEYFEYFSLIIFSFEYVTRLWACTSQPQYKHPFFGRLRYAGSFMAFIDFIAIAPFFFPLLGFDLRFLRSVRLVRLFRVAKLTRYVPSLRLFAKVFISKKEELVLTSLVMLLLVVIISSLMFYIEHNAQPEKFPDIPSTMWWSVATLTTIGYGDVYPITPLGKFFSALVSIVGIGVFALPTGIVGAGFVDELQKSKKRKVCPHCGEELE